MGREFWTLALCPRMETGQETSVKEPVAAYRITKSHCPEDQGRLLKTNYCVKAAIAASSAAVHLGTSRQWRRDGAAPRSWRQTLPGWIVELPGRSGPPTSHRRSQCHVTSLTPLQFAALHCGGVQQRVRRLLCCWCTHHNQPCISSVLWGIVSLAFSKPSPWRMPTHDIATIHDAAAFSCPCLCQPCFVARPTRSRSALERSSGRRRKSDPASYAGVVQ